MQITLNLATRPFADLGPTLKRLRIAMAGLALSAVTLGLVLYFVQKKTEAAQARVQAMDNAITSLAAEHKGYEQLMQRPENQLVLDETDALNELFDEKSFSWTVVMKDLETVLPAPIQITMIEPARTKDGRVILHLRIMGPRDKNIELVENMERSDRFRRPRIVGQSPDSSGGPGDKIEPVSASSVEDLDLLTDYNLSASAGTERGMESGVAANAMPSAPGGAK